MLWGFWGCLFYGALLVVEALAVFTYAVLRVLSELNVEPIACWKEYVFSIGA